MADYPLPEPDLLRRLLLLFLTLVLVARPLVWGEDPALVSDFSDTSGLALILLTLLAMAAWAGWRLATKQPAVYLGPVDYALLAMSLLLAVGVGGLGLRRAAMLAGWEWFALGLVLVLVRQLAVRPEDKQGILCVLLASVVALSAQGTYQAIRDIPVEAKAASAKGVKAWVKDEAARSAVNPSAYEVMQLEQRLEKRQVHGPYFHPASLAGVLVLGVPVILAGMLASVRGGGNPWQTIALAGCVLMAGVILWMTGVRVALCALAAVVVGAVCLVWPGRRAFGVRAAVAALLTVGCFAALVLTGAAESSVARAREVWPAAWRLFEHHFWLGLGPGQFQFFYPRDMAETAGPRVVEPGNFLLEIGTTGGAFALVMLALGVVLFARALLRWRAADLAAVEEPVAPAPAAAPPAEQPVRWEFYMGGMVGLVMSFVFRAASLPPDGNAILQEALRVGIHAVVWFAAFALFEGIAWTEGEYVGGLCAGIVALLLTLFFANGIGFPSVAVYLWAAVGLVLAVVTPRPAPWLSRQPLLVQLPVPVLLATSFGFFALVGYPPTATAAALRNAQYAGNEFFTNATTKPEERKIKDLPAFIRKQIIEPLRAALESDPNDVRLLTALSAWYGQLWRLTRYDEGAGKLSEDAVIWAKRAQRANPEWVEGYTAEFEVRVYFASILLQDIDRLEKQIKDPKHPVNDRMRARQGVDSLQKKRQEEFRLAAEVLAAYLPRDRTNPELHMRLAAALYEIKSPLAPSAAREARRLDGLVKPPRGLSDPQREQLAKWLGKESAK